MLCIAYSIKLKAKFLKRLKIGQSNCTFKHTTVQQIEGETTKSKIIMKDFYYECRRHEV
ncbi:hypothetical protein ES288_A07G087000v1 [Gossypium darwinii]|uniref:Uncharacterized protein n=1 Tax=Gossypium darwinii TaxID=34276 RepID=A0A5D2FXA0_GOSDA|nr:hypothetical protein ES288_A07G087000v1 [Gossypium darwinii]